MLRWLLPLLAASMAKQSAGLAQAVSPKLDHVAIHEGFRRTATHSSQSVTATVGHLAEVGFNLPQNPAIISGLAGNTVYGGLMLMTVTPQRFARDPAVARAVQGGIELVASVLNMPATRVNASLTWMSNFPEAVRVDFDVAFRTLKGRQAFTRSVAENGGKLLADFICAGTPKPFNGRCKLPGERQARTDSGEPLMSLTGLDMQEVLAVPASCYGSIVLKTLGPPQLFVQDPEWQEVVAMAISARAWVSRLQVGTLMAVVAETVRVDFWLTTGKVPCSQEAIARVVKTADYIRHWADVVSAGWRVSSKYYKDFPIYGRMMLQVPRPQFFATNASVSQAVERAAAAVAKSPGPEASQLSVTNVSVSLATVGDMTGVVLVKFRVAFAVPRDRQVFAWDFARDGGQRLLSGLNTLMPIACEGHCRLPGQRWEEASDAATADAERAKQPGALVIFVPDPRSLASDPHIPEAVALAISQMTSVSLQQVGILVTGGDASNLFVDFWVATGNATLRQAAVRRVELAAVSQFSRCTLGNLDRMYSQDRSRSSVDLAFGSVVLAVPDALRFANSSVVRNALKSAIAQVAAVSIRQVTYLLTPTRLWKEFPDFVRVDFRVAVSTRGVAKNLTRALAADGTEKLVRQINELVPQPFRGFVRLPSPNYTEAGNATLRGHLGRPYGTMLLYMFHPRRYADEVRREAVALTIAEVAAVPRAQVGVVLSVKSPVLLSIDFWVTSPDAALQRAAVQRVNEKWADGNLQRLWQRMGHSPGCPVFTVAGGSVLRGVGRFKC